MKDRTLGIYTDELIAAVYLLHLTSIVNKYNIHKKRNKPISVLF